VDRLVPQRAANRQERCNVGTITLGLRNCYGIGALDATLDFPVDRRTVAIYAHNGSMKTSLATAFLDLSEGRDSLDRHFPDRSTVRTIVDETGSVLDGEAVVVVKPYDARLGPTERSATLLVNADLRNKYEQIHAVVDRARGELASALKKQSGSRATEREVSKTFANHDDRFVEAILTVYDEVVAREDSQFAQVPHNVIFEPRVVALLENPEFRNALSDYVDRYDELLEASQYFHRGRFSYYDAEQVAKNLRGHGFFDAKHSLRLNGADSHELTTAHEFEEVVAREKQAITDDPELRRKFMGIEKQLTTNASVREFWAYVSANRWLIPELGDLAALSRELWLSYLKATQDAMTDLVAHYRAAQDQLSHIKGVAANEGKLWQRVIEIFNQRFYVPFKLEVTNQLDVVLGLADLPNLAFTFIEGEHEAPVARDELVTALSQGERRALYILNVLFEVEARKQAGMPTLFVIDDIADSFDYRNKYAIVRYLEEIHRVRHFRQIILTHNFDFLRTLASRFVGYGQCHMVSRTGNSIALVAPHSIRNPFLGWKRDFFTDETARAACIPFIRNLIEYMRGPKDADYLVLTSVLHWKPDSTRITQAALDDIFRRLFGITGAWTEEGSVLDSVLSTAGDCAAKRGNASLAEKIVLSLGIRLAAERHMVHVLNDNDLWAELATKKNQTARLFQAYAAQATVSPDAMRVLEDVLLMTPENIHLNSFMYEPILDMSEDHLRTLFRSVVTLGL